jgi:hypothetical protein
VNHAPTSEVVRWALTETPESEPFIVLVIADEEDDPIVAAVASENEVPSRRFGGLWGSGEKDGNYLVVFRLIERGLRDHAIERNYWTMNLHRELLDAIVDVPHLVGLLPREFAGELRSLEDLLPRLGAALFVLVEDHSPQVQHVLDVRTID